jgi:hypothetical protein
MIGCNPSYCRLRQRPTVSACASHTGLETKLGSLTQRQQKLSGSLHVHGQRSCKEPGHNVVRTMRSRQQRHRMLKHKQVLRRRSAPPTHRPSVGASIAMCLSRHLRSDDSGRLP